MVDHTARQRRASLRTLALGALALLATMVPAGVAAANVPVVRDRADAKSFARNYWQNWRGESAPCAHVDLLFQPVSDRGILGFVVRRRGECTIHMNSNQRWNWSKLCATVTHEYGHVIGHGHTRPSASIMSPTWPNPVWGQRFRACEYQQGDANAAGVKARQPPRPGARVPA